jgi:hypothetical protein
MACTSAGLKIKLEKYSLIGCSAGLVPGATTDAPPIVVGQASTVIMAKLDHDPVAALYYSQNLVEPPLSRERTRAATTDCPVRDGGVRGSERILEIHAPALRVAAGPGHGAVTAQMDRHCGGGGKGREKHGRNMHFAQNGI